MREWIATGRALQTVWKFGRLVEMHMLVGSFPKQDCEEKNDGIYKKRIGRYC